MTSVTFLQQTAPADLRPGRRASVTITQIAPPQPDFNARMYRDVGAGWKWSDRRRWSPEHWAEYVADPRVRTLRAARGAEVVGFAELRTTPFEEGVEVEIVYFGLLPRFTGQGLGGWMLTEVVCTAWATPGCRRLWLHTCADDSPAALPNYLARGFVEYAHSEHGCADCTA